MQIKPGIGIGNIRYGISEQELVALLGDPTSRAKEEYVEGTGDWHSTLDYQDRGIYFTFNKEDDYRLGGITVYKDGYIFLGTDVFGMSRSELETLLFKSTGEKPTFEDFSVDELDSHWCLTHDKTGIMFWLDSNMVTEMQCSYLFEDDDDTVIWP